MQSYQVGGLYAGSIGGGKFSIVKILGVDEAGMHLRMYSNVFKGLPSKLDESLLRIDGPYCGRDCLPGIGHVAVSNETIANFQLKFIQHSTVVESELNSYQMWLRLGEGKYF